MFKEETYV